MTLAPLCASDLVDKSDLSCQEAHGGDDFLVVADDDGRAFTVHLEDPFPGPLETRDAWRRTRKGSGTGRRGGGRSLRQSAPANRRKGRAPGTGREAAGTEVRLGGMTPVCAPCPPPNEAIPMRLPCPGCGELHIDIGEFATKVHHTHACQACGMVWRPAIVATVGVRFLPGFRNGAVK